MSSISGEQGRARKKATEDPSLTGRARGPGKQVRSGARDAGEQEATAASPGGPRDEGQAEQRAGDWEMTPGLSSALALQGDEAEGASAAAGDAGPVRRKAVATPSWADASTGGGEVEVARAGFAGSPSSFPHREAIERSFGAPLPATAHTGEAAKSATGALGAEGYALGNQVAFASSSPSLEVAAHEAAHVMQSTSGVQLFGGEGAYEAHADAVAERVVRGESSSDLLAAGPVASAAVRRAPAPPAAHDALAAELQMVIDGAVWKEIRKTAYPAESAGGIKRAKERKTGARPDLSGLGKITALEHFAAAIKGVQATWATLSPANRLKAIATAINAEMTLAEVPEFLEVKAIQTEFKGSFASSLWRFNLSKAMLDKSPLPDADAGELCNTALHEARHAEQQFLAARFAAGPPQNRDAGAISTEQNIPATIAAKAVAKKFTVATDPKVAALGKEMYKANVTDGDANQKISDDDFLPEMEVKRTEATAALTALKAKPNAATIGTATTKRDELKAAIAEVKRRYTLYRNIPYEADAHEVGDAAEQAFKGWP